MPTQDTQDATRLVQRAATFPDDAEVQIIILTQRPKAEPELFRLNLSKGLSAEFRDRARSYVEMDLGRRSLVEYAAARTPSANEAVYANSTRAPLLHSLQESIRFPENLPILDPSQPQSRHIRLYFLRIGSSQEEALNFFSALGPRARLSRSNRIAAAFSGGAYDSIQDEVLIFDPGLDGLWAGEVLVATIQGTIERIFGLLHEISEVAEEAFTRVTENLGIDNFEAFQTAATSDLNMMRKLRSIADKISSDERYLSAMTMSGLLVFIDSRPSIEIDVEGTGEARRLVFHNDVQRRWRILRLLDDDYLQSQLTQLEYEANSKNVIS